MVKFSSVRHHGYSGFWVLGLTPAAAAKGQRRGRRGEEGGEEGGEGGWALVVERDARRGWASCGRRGGVGPAAGGVFVVRAPCFVSQTERHAPTLMHSRSKGNHEHEHEHEHGHTVESPFHL